MDTHRYHAAVWFVATVSAQIAHLVNIVGAGYVGFVAVKPPSAH